jgi:NTP pyrophosphatase (non-canonical NTP hydrolase)
MDAKTQEILDILQEECAEVIVEISKCRRFGLDSRHYKTHIEHKEMLEQEIGDVLAMVDLLADRGIIDNNMINKAKQKKIDKLKIWSSIFK